MRTVARRVSWSAAVVCMVAGTVGAVGTAWGADGARLPAASAARDHAALGRLRAAAPGVRLLELGGSIKRVYGPNLATGASATESAEAFLKGYATIFGVETADLIPWSLSGNGSNVTPLMPDDDGNLRFDLVTFTQTHQGLPVFRADVRVLARNTAEHDVVWVGNALRPVAGMVIDAAALASPNVTGAVADAELRYPGLVGGEVTPPELVIWAGVGDASEGAAVEPRLAVTFEATTAARPHEPGYGRWVIVADAATGRMLWSESLVHNADVSGRISGMATTGIKAAECNPEADIALPYAAVAVGAVTGFADVNGNYALTGVPSGSVTVSAGPRGRYFRTFDTSGQVPDTTASGTGTVGVQLNTANTDQTVRAGVNAYLQANVVRDMVLSASPAYPTIAGQTNFTINVGLNDTCNAFYDGGSINFFNSGGGCNNTAFYDVVHHEYGHHVVQTGRSGQGQYGEGMGDCMGVLISDQPLLGIGFQGNCNGGIRNANNTRQYPQDPNSVEVHDGGMLISGCLWSTRNAMVTAAVPNYGTLLKRLCVNSVPMHSGSTIAPDITVDWLTLDDNDGNINNGTPHYAQINAGFTAHNMDGPVLDLVNFEFPDGLPASITPGAARAIRVNVVPSFGAPQDNTGRFTYRVGSGSDQSVAMARTGPNQYVATIPAQACGSLITYSFSARASDGTIQSDPETAPQIGYMTTSAYGVAVKFTDDFQTNRGWTVTNAGLTDGPWTRGAPVIETDPARAGAVPEADFDGSGQCYLTDNVAGNSDVDGGTTTLTSPVIDASGGSSRISYARWYSNNLGADPEADTFAVEVSGNNGSTWTGLETVGPSGAEVRGGWIFKTFDIPPAAATSQFRVRFIASDLGTGSLVEAAIDAVEVVTINCTAPVCPADFNGDGFVDFFDYDDFVGCFESSDCPPGKTGDFNGDGFQDFFDYDDFVGAFEVGC